MVKCISIACKQNWSVVYWLPCADGDICVLYCVLGTSAVNVIVPKNFAHCNNQEGLPGESDPLASSFISIAAVTNHSEASWKRQFWLADGMASWGFSKSQTLY